MPQPGFRYGTLVQLHGIKEPLVDEEASEKGKTVDVNGMVAQLIEYFEDFTKCKVATVDGHIVSVSVENIRAQDSVDLDGCDLFVGPMSKEEVTAAEVLNRLVLQGYAVTKNFRSEKTCQELKKVVEQLDYSRTPEAFEQYYLGRDSTALSCLVDFESPDIPSEVLKSALKAEEGAMTDLGLTLGPMLYEMYGVDAPNRTNIMVRKTFKSEEAEMDFPLAAEATRAEQEAFAALMKRRRLCMMQFLGPLAGTLTLIPKEHSHGEEIVIETKPNTMVIFLTEQFHYGFTCSEGETLVLQMWMLSPRPEFSIDQFFGDTSMFSSESKGLSDPEGDCVVCTGLGTTLGGDAHDHSCYWLVLNKAAVDTSCQTPITRWDVDLYCDFSSMNNAMSQGKAYTAHYGYIDGIELFDNKFFGISPNEAASMDPNQRKVLETYYVALNMGGYDIKDLQRSPQHIGVFVGVSGSEWQMVEHPQDCGCGVSEAIISNRFNFSLNLKGPSQTINTACSAGLVATHTAKLHLLYRDYEPAVGVLGGGTQMAISPGPFIGCCMGTMLSFLGRSFTYDVTADGYMRGEGTSCGFFQYKRYTNECFSVLAGSDVNQDGRSASLTAPNGPSQERCARAAMRSCWFSSIDVDCAECHGTGTALGDPIEVGAFRRVHTMPQKREFPVGLTSSKSNQGHLEGGAGIAGFIKAILQTYHCELSPNVHLRERNPHLDLEGFPHLILSECITTTHNSSATGVNSFGFGGTNAHGISYSRNTATTRSAVAKDVRPLAMKRIREAPAPLISILADNPEEWETSGMPLTGTRGVKYQVEFRQSGETLWRELVDLTADRVLGRPYLSGTFNGWEMTEMSEDLSVPDLYTLEVAIGETGQELVQVVVDEDLDQVFYPRVQRCKKRASKLVGPQPIDEKLQREDATWCLEGAVGDTYRVEFYSHKSSRSLSWIKVKL